MTRYRAAAAAVIFLVAGILGAQQEYNSRLTGILRAYDAMMSIPMDDDVEDLPGEAWDVVSAAVNQGFLRFTVNPESQGGLIEGASFRIDTQAKTQYVVFSPRFIDFFPGNNSAVFARMTREFKSAAEFFLNPQEFYRNNLDPLTRFLMRMDAMRTEALLIRDRLAPSGIPIGPYEQFLLDSLATDDLRSAALFIERASLPLAQGLELARLQFEESGDADALRKIIIRSGAQIGKEREQIGAAINAVIYPAAVATNSWLEFTPWIISRIHNREGEPKAFEEILELETDYAVIRKALEYRLESDLTALEQVYNDTVKGFDKR